MLLKDKVAIITGGGSGIGEAIVRKFVQEGASIAIFDKNIDFAEEVTEESGIKHRAFEVDVSCKDSIEKAVSEVANIYGKIDILVNNAGIFKDSKLINMKENNWDLVMDVNLKGTFLCIQAVAPIMTEQKYGKIVNVSSVAYKGNYGQSNYSASKAAINALTTVSAMELAPYITVNSFAPGPTETPLFASMDEKGKERLIRKIPLARVASSEEQANVALFLASDMSSYITGVILDVDGGISQGINLR